MAAEGSSGFALPGVDCAYARPADIVQQAIRCHHFIIRLVLQLPSTGHLMALVY
jgi:hypothetical protein